MQVSSKPRISDHNEQLASQDLPLPHVPGVPLPAPPCAFLVENQVERDNEFGLVELLRMAKQRCGFVVLREDLEKNPLVLAAVEKVIHVAKEESKEISCKLIFEYLFV